MKVDLYGTALVLEAFRGHDVSLNSLSALIMKLSLNFGDGGPSRLGVSRG